MCFCEDTDRWWVTDDDQADDEGSLKEEHLKLPCLGRCAVACTDACFPCFGLRIPCWKRAVQAGGVNCDSCTAALPGNNWRFKRCGPSVKANTDVVCFYTKHKVVQNATYTLNLGMSSREPSAGGSSQVSVKTHKTLDYVYVMRKKPPPPSPDHAQPGYRCIKCLSDPGKTADRARATVASLCRKYNIGVNYVEFKFNVPQTVGGAPSGGAPGAPADTTVNTMFFAGAARGNPTSAPPQPRGSAPQQPDGSTLPQPDGAALPQSRGSAPQQPDGSTLQQPDGAALPQSRGSAPQQPDGSTLPQPRDDVLELKARA